MRPDNREDQDKKLFIGGLSHETDENALKDFYSQWGEIIDVVVMKEPHTGKSRGFGFVTFSDSSSVDAAQSKRPHEINGKKVDSKRAMPKDDTSPEIHANVNKIFVRNLRPEITEEDLRQYFIEFGEIVDATVVKNKETNTSRGFGFVTFADNDSVDKIILRCPHELHGEKIEVKKAVDKNELAKLKPRQPRGGYGPGGMGGGGYPPHSNWGPYGGGGQGYYQQPYGQPYGGQGGYAYPGPAGAPPAYYYDQPGAAGAPAGEWAGAGAANQTAGDFGTYNQGFSGGPVRGQTAGQQGAGGYQQQRPGPYQQQQQPASQQR